MTHTPETSKSSLSPEIFRLRAKVVNPKDQPKDYPLRAEIKSGYESWDTVDHDYNPPFYKSAEKNDRKYPQQPSDIQPKEHAFLESLGFTFDSKGMPLVPLGRLGLSGPGRTPGIGAIRAVDPIVTRNNPDDGSMEVLLVVRGDNGQSALPGGKVDPEGTENGETVWEDEGTTFCREFDEEVGKGLGQDIINARAKPIYNKYVIVGDNRNTDNSAFVTYPMHLHISKAEAEAIRFKPKNPKEIKEIKWVKITEANLNSLFATHKDFVLDALAQLDESKIEGLDAGVRTLLDGLRKNVRGDISSLGVQIEK
ncbi:MAG: NUDIX domain-containing protein [Candidatus Peregrinibacteria bacterium]|nr:NUDIX domain-containing protein [Candidatus Peregrinibacteria bacterium]